MQEPRAAQTSLTKIDVNLAENVRQSQEFDLFSPGKMVLQSSLALTVKLNS